MKLKLKDRLKFRERDDFNNPLIWPVCSYVRECRYNHEENDGNCEECEGRFICVTNKMELCDGSCRECKVWKEANPKAKFYATPKFFSRARGYHAQSMMRRHR